MKALYGFKDIFTEPKIPFSLLTMFEPKICGDLSGYEVDLGIAWEHSKKILRFRVRLKNSINLPWFFWNKFSIAGSGWNTIEIQKGKWLAECIYSAETIRGIRKYLEGTTKDKIRTTCLRLIALAEKID